MQPQIVCRALSVLVARICDIFWARGVQGRIYDLKIAKDQNTPEQSEIDHIYP